MNTTYINTGSTARLSGDIDDLFNQLERKVCPTLGPTCRGCPDCGPVMGDSTYREVFEQNAAAPVNQDVPTSQGSSRPIPVSIAAELLDSEGFDPLTTFADFSTLIDLAYHHKISYHAVIKRTYDLVTHEIPFSELTVHQIVSAIYAAAEEQSK